MLDFFLSFFSVLGSFTWTTGVTLWYLWMMTPLLFCGWTAWTFFSCFRNASLEHFKFRDGTSDYQKRLEVAVYWFLTSYVTLFKQLSRFTGMALSIVSLKYGFSYTPPAAPNRARLLAQQMANQVAASLTSHSSSPEENGGSSRDGSRPQRKPLAPPKFE